MQQSTAAQEDELTSHTKHKKKKTKKDKKKKHKRSHSEDGILESRSDRGSFASGGVGIESSKSNASPNFDNFRTKFPTSFLSFAVQDLQIEF